MTQEEINNTFTYHKPFGDQPTRYENIRKMAKAFVELLELYCPNSREKSMAITNIQQAVMWANASIAIHEKEISIQHD